MKNKSKLYIKGILIKVIGYILFSLGTIGVIGIISVGHKIFRIGIQLKLLYWILLLAAAFLLSLYLIRVGQRTFLKGKKIIIKFKSIDFQVDESINTVLYLRSFNDDYFTATTYDSYHILGINFPQITTEEEILAKEFRKFGKFISAANPRNTLPNPGAIQINFDNDKWEKEIIRIMKASKLVLIRIGHGEYLKWEIEHAFKYVSPEKLILLLPANEDMYEYIKDYIKNHLSKNLPELNKGVFNSISTISLMIYFDNDFNPKISIFKDARYRASASKPLKPILRYAMKPIYEKFEIPWKAPSIPKLIYLPVILNTYLALLCLGFCIGIPIWDLLDKNTPWFLICLFLFVLILPMLLAFKNLFVKVPILIKAIQQKEPLDIINTVEDVQKIEIPEEIETFYRETQQRWRSNEFSFLEDMFSITASVSFNDFYDMLQPKNNNCMSVFFEKFFPPLQNECLLITNDVLEEDEETWFILTNLRVIQKNGIDNIFYEVKLNDIDHIEVSGFWTKKLKYHLKSGNTIFFDKVDLYVSEEYIYKLIEHISNS